MDMRLERWLWYVVPKKVPYVLHNSLIRGHGVFHHVWQRARHSLLASEHLESAATRRRRSNNQVLKVAQNKQVASDGFSFSGKDGFNPRNKDLVAKASQLNLAMFPQLLARHGRNDTESIFAFFREQLETIISDTLQSHVEDEQQLENLVSWCA